MQIMIVNLAYDPALDTAEALLDEYFVLAGWAEGLHEAGSNVTVFQRFTANGAFSSRKVMYSFTADRYGPMLQPWQISWPLLQQVCTAADKASLRGEQVVVQINGLVFPLMTTWLRARLPRACPLVVQHHAERPFRGSRSLIQRFGFQDVDGFFFTNNELAGEWLYRGIIGSPAQVYEVMEASSNLAWQEKYLARQQTNLTGQPIILWTGNLYANKDPLTVLAGFERLLHFWPQAKLYMAFRYGDLLSQVKQAVAQSRLLSRQVTLLGHIPYQQIGVYYNSADIFVQGSAREGSGLALLDALACGAIPVVTDIPAFRTITDYGRIGALWPVADENGFVAALRSVLAHPLALQAQAAKDLFDEKWCFTAVAQQARSCFDRIWRVRQDTLAAG